MLTRSGTSRCCWGEVVGGEGEGGSSDDVVERRQIHDSTKARAYVTWAGRSTSPSATPWQMAAVAVATALLHFF